MRLTETAQALRGHVSALAASVRLLARWAIALPQVELKIVAARHLHQDCSAVEGMRHRLAELLHDVEPREIDVHDIDKELRAVLAGDGVRQTLSAYAAFKETLRGRIADHRARVSGIADQPTAMLLDEVDGGLARQVEEAERAVKRLGVDYPDDDTHDGFRASGDLLSLFGPAPRHPARDARFSCSAPPALTEGEGVTFEGGRLALLHVNLTDLEIATIEACARCILDFPEMPWQFVRDMARQCWDEARHAELLGSRLLELGGSLGAFRISHGLWEMATDQPLAVRLGLHQRLGEWIGVDVGRWHARRFEKAGDLATASLFEYIVADEVTHVAFGNRWIDSLCPTREERETTYRDAAARRAGGTRPDVRNLGEGPLLAPFHEDLCLRGGYAPPDVAHLAERYRRYGSTRQ